MKCLKVSFVAVAVGLSVGAAPAVLVDLTAGDFVSVLGDGAVVPAWVNRGVLGGEFLPAGNGEGTVFHADVEGVPAVTFTARGRDSTLTNRVSPNVICGGVPWSFEVWVYKPVLNSNTEIVFTWTAREQWPNGAPAGSCMEFRYGTDAGNAVEHYGGENNLPWGGAVPPAGQWHHVAVTRGADGMERLYLNGALRMFKRPQVLDLRDDVGFFTLGSVLNMNNNNWDSSFRGSIASLRIYDGALTQRQVVENYEAACAGYGLAAAGAKYWDGAAGAWGAWGNPQNWLGGVPADNDLVYIENGGKAGPFSGTLALQDFQGYHGGFSMTGGAMTLLQGVSRTLNLGCYAGCAFDFQLSGGTFTLQRGAQGNHDLHIGREGGFGSAVVGGGSGAAWLCVDSDVVVGIGSAGSGYMEVLEKGLVTVSNGMFYVTANGNATGTVVVAGGTVRGLRDNRLIISHGTGAHGTLILNDGLVEFANELAMSESNPNANNRAELFLNGGVLAVRRFNPNGTGTNIAYLNGGVLRNHDNRTGNNPWDAFFWGLTAAYVQAGGAHFDVVEGTTIDVSQNLLADPNSLGGGFTKTGPGTLNLKGEHTFTGDISVEEGLLFLRDTAALPSNYDGTIFVHEGAGIGWDSPTGANDLLQRIHPSSSGALMLSVWNRDEAIDLSGHPNLSLGMSGNMEYHGAMSPAGGHYRFYVSGGGNTYRHVIAGSATTVTVDGSWAPAMGYLDLHGDNTYLGGTTINGGIVVMYHGNALGPYRQGVRDIGIYNGAVLRIEVGITPDFLQRIRTDSHGAIILGPNNNNVGVDFDFSALPGISFSSADGRDYNATLTPHAGVGYHLGGNRQGAGNSGLGFRNLTDGPTPRKVLMDLPGTATLLADNTFSGGITVTNKGILWMRNDTALGAVPPAPVPGYLYINDGGFRLDANVPFPTAHPHRGIWVGDDGATFYTSSGRYFAWLGDLHGSGAVTGQDNGVVMFGGANNTWSGTLTLAQNNNEGAVAIGHGNEFSWVKSNVIQGNGMFGTATDLDITWSDKFANPLGNVPPQLDAPDGTSANIGLRKLGSGTLTLDIPNTYRRETRIESGTLKVATENAIPWGSGRSALNVMNNNIYPAGILDINGFNVNVNALTGAGTVQNSQTDSRTLTIGNADAGGQSFWGTVVPPTKITKVGSGTQMFAKGASLGTLTVNQGGVFAGAESALGDVALTSVNAAFNIGLSTADTHGLTGEYYNFDFRELSGLIDDEPLKDLDVFEALLAPYAPALVLSSASFGHAFDTGDNGARFQGDYGRREHFYGRWTGEFYAEADGTYTFATASDDGSTVFINRELVVENSRDQGYDFNGRVSGTIPLTTGWHDITICFYQRTGGRALTVFMAPPDGTEAALPQALLRPYPATIASLHGVVGSRTEIIGNASLLLASDTPNAYTGRLVSASADARFIKDGTGDFTFAGQTLPEFNGQIIVNGGNLRLEAASPTTSPIDIKGNGTLIASPANTDWGNLGLKGTYYANGNYHGGPNDIPSLESYFNGRSGEPIYIANTTQTGPDALPTAQNFAYETGTHFPGPYAQDYPPAGEKYHFSARFQGKFLALEPGDYTFALSSDDRGDLFINGVKVIDNVQWNSGIVSSPTLHLQPGTHDLQIAWGQGEGGYRINLYVTPPGGERIPMPNAWLRPSVSAVPGVNGGGNLLLPYPGSYLCLDINQPQAFNGEISGTAGSEIEKNGTAALTLTGNNDAFEGTWYILKGTLIAGGGNSPGGTLGGERAYVASGAKLVFDSPQDITYTGTISGNGEISSIGNGRVTLTNLGNDFQGTFTSGTFVFTGEATSVIATCLQQGENAPPLTVHFEDGAKLYIPAPTGTPLAIPPLVFSNATLSLPLTDGNAYYLDALSVHAGSSVNVSMNTLSGLFGRYYAFSSGDPNSIAPHFESVELFEAFTETLTFICSVSSWEAGDAMSFGSYDNQQTHPLKFPQPIIDRKDNFVAIWKGQIRITEPGEYAFETWSDDNSMLFINGQLIVDNNGGHGMLTRAGTATLTPGLHDIAILFGQGGGGYGLEVRIGFPGQPVQPLPNHMLIAHPADLTGASGTGIPLADISGTAFTLEIGTLGVIGGTGTGTIDITGGAAQLDGKLLLNDLYIETPGAVIATIGNTLVSGLNLHVTMGSEPPKGVFFKIGDFSQTPSGLPLTGKTRTLDNATDRGKLIYRIAERELYISTKESTLIILR